MYRNRCPEFTPLRFVRGVGYRVGVVMESLVLLGFQGVLGVPVAGAAAVGGICSRYSWRISLP